MRRGGAGKGVFSGDAKPVKPWRTFSVRMRAPGVVSEKTVGALPDAELNWIARVVLAESQARALAKLESKASVTNAG